jgi:hypothetical protein
MLVQYSDDEGEEESTLAIPADGAAKVTLHAIPNKDESNNNNNSDKQEEEEENYLNLDLLKGNVKKPARPPPTEEKKEGSDDSSEEDEPQPLIKRQKVGEDDTCNAFMPNARKAGR